MLNPNPVERIEALVQQGKTDEALNYGAKVSDMLRRTLYDVVQAQLRIYLGLFKDSARARDVEQARHHFRKVEKLSATPPLPDAAVEERYFQGMVATVTAPTGVNRKQRHWLLAQHVRQIATLEGDLVECGCFRGLSSWMICQTLNQEFGPFDGTGFHIFDSFEGLSEPGAEDVLDADLQEHERLASMMVPGRFACTEADVRRNLSAFPGIRYHPGWLPQSLQGVEERRYRFLHLDVDLYEPTKGALDYFYPRMVSGGIIISDDYGWPGGRKAFDEFCAENRLQLEHHPNNQAVLRKP